MDPRENSEKSGVDLALHTMDITCFIPAELGITNVRTVFQTDRQKGLELSANILCCIEAQMYGSNYTDDHDLKIAQPELDPCAKERLLDIIDLFASYNIDNRLLLRRFITAVFPFSR